MAEHNFRFGFLTTEEIEYGLEHKILKPFFILYNKDNHLQYIVKEDYTLFEIRNKMGVYSSESDAVNSINENPSDHFDGEIISILDDEEFKAYILNHRNGRFTVSKIYNEKDFSYDSLYDVPLKQVGKVPSERVNILDLEDGMYKVNYFVSPSGADIDSIVGNVFYIETLVNGNKNIKRIAPNAVFDYSVVNGKVSAKKYATEEFVKEHIKSLGYMTESDVDAKIDAYDVIVNQRIQDYVKNTVERLVYHMINEELDRRYATEEDVESIFTK